MGNKILISLFFGEQKTQTSSVFGMNANEVNI